MVFSGLCTSEDSFPILIEGSGRDDSGQMVPGILMPYTARAASGSARTPAMWTRGISRLLLNAQSLSTPPMCTSLAFRD